MKTKALFLAFLLIGLILHGSAFAGSDVRQCVDKSSASVSTVSATTLIAANQNRKFLFIQNIAATSIWISHTGIAAVDTAGSFELTPGASLTYEGDTMPKNAFSIISETSTGKVTACEG